MFGYYTTKREKSYSVHWSGYGCSTDITGDQRDNLLDLGIIKRANDGVFDYQIVEGYTMNDVDYPPQA